MTRSIRRILALVPAFAAALSVPAPGWAQSLTIARPLTPTLVARPVCSLPPAATPAVLDMSVSVPTAGAGNVCTNDTQCTVAGESCTFPLGSRTGTCSASGHLVRDAIHYVAGPFVDLEVTVPRCVHVTDVLMGGTSLTGSGIDAQATPGSWWTISSAATTFGGQPANRQRVRVQSTNLGDGQSTSIQVRATASLGGASILSAPITVVHVAAVNAAMRTTATETRIRNSFVTSIYKRFGDGDQTYSPTGVRLYDLSWSQVSTGNLMGGLYHIGSDMRIGSGAVAFSVRFKADKFGCDPDVFAGGRFTLVPNEDGVDIRWLDGPRGDAVATGACAWAPLDVWDILTNIFTDEAGIAQPFAKTISSGFGADDAGHIKVCELCEVADVKIGGGKIEIWTLPPTDRVRVNVSTTDLVDMTATPNRGLLLPAGLRAAVVGGGSYDMCQAAVVQIGGSCSPKFVADMEGLFNWWGSDVPVPSVIHCNNGTCATIAARQDAWARLLGVTRDVTKLPAPSFPAGSLIARRTPSANTVAGATTRVRISNGCVVPPDPHARYRVAFEVNDVASPVTGAPPSRGRLFVTVMLAQSAGQSEVFFGNSATCQAAQSTLPTLQVGGSGVILR